MKGTNLKVGNVVRPLRQDHSKSLIEVVSKLILRPLPCYLDKEIASKQFLKLLYFGFDFKVVSIALLRLLNLKITDKLVTKAI